MIAVSQMEIFYNDLPLASHLNIHCEYHRIRILLKRASDTFAVQQTSIRIQRDFEYANACMILMI